MPWQRLYKPVLVSWLVAELVIVGLTLWQVPAWRSLCREAAIAPGQIVAIHDPNHHRAHYRFQAEGKSWEGTVASYRGNNAFWDLGDSVEVFYAPSDPSVNQTDHPPAAWWGYATGFFVFYGVILTTIAAGMLQRLLDRLDQRAGAF